MATPTEQADFAEGDRFRGEYEVELERWFRRRFGWLCVAFLVWEGVSAAALVSSFFFGFDQSSGGGPGSRALVVRGLTAASSGVVLAIVLHFWLRVRPAIETRDAAVRAATQMILALGAINFAFELAILLAWPRAPVFPLLSIAFWHLMASLFLPWSPRESLRPILPLLVAWAVWYGTRGFLLASSTGELLQRGFELLFSPLVLLPGAVVAWWRLTRHRRKFRREVSRRFFVSMRRELQQARKIHESLFPQPSDDGIFRFEYRYRPAQEIGGDFVHLWSDHQGVVHMAIIDVTGHGLASAMTVNRLYGELERLRYEHPYLRPGSVLSLLNRYVLLTLAPHKIFATAALVRIDPRDGSVIYANAGHPPLFLRTRSGQVHDLDSTQPMLGALQPQDFGVEDASATLEPGDALIAYTDGAFEARNKRGHKMGLGRVREALRRQPPPPKWPDFIIQLVEGFSGGSLDDDILVASLQYQRRPATLARMASPVDETSAEAVVAP